MSAAYQAGKVGGETPPADIEAALRASPHPPSSVDPLPNATPWRPLSERYEPFVAEQAWLDDHDEEAAIRVLLEAQEAAAAERGGGSEVDSPASSSAAPAKKARTSLAAAAIVASSKLASLGVVKAEAATGVSELPGGSPMPVHEVKMEADGAAE